MICEKCGNNSFDFVECELICDDCGAAYVVEYIGYYQSGSCELIEMGFENEQWLEECKDKSKNR
jgi:hypothetical protein